MWQNVRQVEPANLWLVSEPVSASRTKTRHISIHSVKPEFTRCDEVLVSSSERSESRTSSPTSVGRLDVTECSSGRACQPLVGKRACERIETRNTSRTKTWYISIRRILIGTSSPTSVGRLDVTTTREVNQEPKIPEISMYIDKN